MKVKLRDEDRRAIDLVLDRSTPSSAKGSPLIPATQGNLRERMGPLEKVLCLLDSYTAEEPAPDLVTRTLRYVASQEGRKSRGDVDSEYSQAPVA